MEPVETRHNPSRPVETRRNTFEPVETRFNPFRPVETCRNTFQSVQICCNTFQGLPPLPLPPPPQRKGKWGRRGEKGGWRRGRGGSLETGLDRSERVSTGFNRSERVSTCFDRFRRVSTGLNGLQYAVCFFFCDNNNTVEKHLFFLIQSILLFHDGRFFSSSYICTTITMTKIQLENIYFS